MKTIVSFIALMTTAMLVSGQTNNIDNMRKVATKGYAEKEVTPDIAYLSISLKEFYMDGNTRKKVFIETLEKQLYDAAMEIGVQKDDFTIQNVYSYNFDTKKRGNELLQSRQYRIKVTNLHGLNAMMEKIDPYGIQSTSISGYDHTQKREIEKELKTAAVKDARQNAEILATADGQTIGKVLVINDNSSFNFNDLMPVREYAMMSKVANADGLGESESLHIDIRPIKLTCYVDAAFELK